LLELRKLEWDSEVFGLPVYSLEATSPVYRTEVCKILGANEDVLLYVHLKDNRAEMHDMLVSQGALLFGTRLIYSKELTGDNLSESSAVVREYHGELDDRIQELSIQAGQYSRFNNDVRLKAYFNDLYTAWIENSLNGQIADKVFVYEGEGMIKGFSTCVVKNSEGWTGLISVDVSCQGKGVGTSLMAANERYFLEKQINCSKVITQEENTKACQLYESCGYEIIRREFVYHWWI
jgi:dTDP-4-amino-4,6-dideoxy-D-galactose acyltransferase